MLYSFNYTFIVTSSWSKEHEDKLVKVILPFDISYEIRRSFLDSNVMKLHIAGNKTTLEKLEIRLLKHFSEIIKVKNFTKISNKIDEKIVINQNNFKLSNFDFKLILKSTLIKNPLEETVKLLSSQKIGIIKNINGYYLCANSTKSQPINKLRKILEQKDKPLPLLVKNILIAEKFLSLSKKEKELMNSDIKPYLRAKRRNIHRLEKVKNIPLQSISPTNIYEVKLPKNSIEEYLVTKTNLPLVFIQIDNYHNFYEKIDFILDFEKDFIEFTDSTMQIIYGKNQIIKAGFGLNIKVREKQLINTPFVSMHTKESGFKNCLIIEGTSKYFNIYLCEKEQITPMYKLDKSPKEYFDTISGKSSDTFIKFSQQYCENLYEVCHEKSFDFSVSNSKININISKKIPDSEKCSTFINTFKSIIKNLYNDKKLPLILCGELFENKNLTENIIEYFDDNNINYFISNTIAINN